MTTHSEVTWRGTMTDMRTKRAATAFGRVRRREDEQGDLGETTRDKEGSTSF